MLPSEILTDIKNGNFDRFAEYIHAIEYPILNKTDSYVVTFDDAGYTLTMNASGEKTFTLPVIGAENIGAYFTFVKKGAGKVNILANTGQTVGASTTAGTIYDNVAAETYATVTLEAISTTQWVIRGFHGTWAAT
ncbi:MAG: hypothetical protein WC208_08245 [Gallionella sp.]|jgi:hypothetical protein